MSSVDSQHCPVNIPAVARKSKLGAGFPLFYYESFPTGYGGAASTTHTSGLYKMVRKSLPLLLLGPTAQTSSPSNEGELVTEHPHCQPAEIHLSPISTEDTEEKKRSKTV